MVIQEKVASEPSQTVISVYSLGPFDYLDNLCPGVRDDHDHAAAGGHQAEGGPVLAGRGLAGGHPGGRRQGGAHHHRLPGRPHR